MFRYNSILSLALLGLFSGITAAGSSAQIQPQSIPSAPTTGSRNTPTTRSIEGTVLSGSGAPVPGARVQLKDSKSLQVRSFIAQKDGTYHFYGLSTEVNYELRAELNGMASKTKTVSVFDSHARVRLNLKLNKKLKS